MYSNFRSSQTANNVAWRLNYCWRVFATGSSFLLFGVGGASIATVIALLLLLIPAKILCRKVAMRYCLSLAFKIYIHILRFLGLLTFEIQNIERIKPTGQLVIANHPSLLDVVFLISLIRNADCIVKSALWNHPLTALPVRVAGYVRNVPERLLEESVSSLAQGNSLIVFPEGTRSRPNRQLSFLRGAANIALSGNKNITPIVICCEPITLLKDQKWYDVPEYPPHYHIRVLPEIGLGEVVEQGVPQCKAARQLTRHMEGLFETERMDASLA